METATKEKIKLLPHTRPGSTINKVYQLLLEGRRLTTLDALYADSATLCLPKYISLLRYKYGVPVKKTWITLQNKKRIKVFWLPNK